MNQLQNIHIEFNFSKLWREPCMNSRQDKLSETLWKVEFWQLQFSDRKRANNFSRKKSTYGFWIGVYIGSVAMVTFKLWKGYHNLNCKKKKVVALLDHFHLMFKSERNYFHFRPFDSVTLQCPIWHYMHITSKTKEINSWALDWSLA